jgi:glycylpeptide N-tetradecanoyltransferase
MSDQSENKTNSESGSGTGSSAAPVPAPAPAPGSGRKSAKTTGMKIEDLFKLLSLPAEKPEPKTMDQYKFWKTQPVPKFDESIDAEGPIDSSKTIADIPAEPSPLPTGFEWSTIDINKQEEVKEVYDLLYHNYIEDDDATFRFKYSPAFLDWALKPPGWKMEWNVGVRVNETGKLVGFISGIPSNLRVRQNPVVNATEINFLCVHKKLRSKRLAPVLIREVTRRVNRTGIWQALYTAGTILPSPISTARYYHRSLNWPKLYEVGFTPLPSGSTPAKQVAKYALPAQQTLDVFRPMTRADLPQIHALLVEFLNRYEIVPVFSEQELDHWLLDSVHNEEKDKVIYSYVVTDPEDSSIITDFVSFYGLESTVLGNDKYDSINTAYSFYYASKSTSSDEMLKNRLTVLFQNALIAAKQNNFDVFNALSLQDNALFLDTLKFGGGDGLLNYYLFNYKAFPIHGGIDKENKLERKLGGVGVVML